MQDIVDALLRRSHEFAGQLYTMKDLAELKKHVSSSVFVFLAQIFTEIAISGVTLDFENVDPNLPTPPTDNFDDSEYDMKHSLIWTRPKDIVFEATESFAGPSVLAAGFLPICGNSYGGDEYYIRPEVDGALYQVYHDWVEPDSAVPVPPNEAVSLVATSFADVIRVCRILN